jgi:hypothetical protein
MSTSRNLYSLPPVDDTSFFLGLVERKDSFQLITGMIAKVTRYRQGKDWLIAIMAQCEKLPFLPMSTSLGAFTISTHFSCYLELELK